MTTLDAVEPLVQKRYMVDLHVDIPIGTPPEDKREIFEDLKNHMPRTHVHYSDFYTVAPGVQNFRFIVSAVSPDAAAGGMRLAASLFVPEKYPFEVHVRDY